MRWNESGGILAFIALSITRFRSVAPYLSKIDWREAKVCELTRLVDAESKLT